MKELGNAVLLLVLALIVLGCAYLTDAEVRTQVDHLLEKIGEVSHAG